MKQTSSWLVCVALALAAGCGDPSVGQSPQHTISDGRHGGVEGFYFLPPLVPEPGVQGNDRRLAPVVAVDPLDAAGNPTTPRLAEYSTLTGSGAERVRDSASHFHVDWDISRTAAATETTYRVRVFVPSRVVTPAGVRIEPQGRELGWIDVQIDRNGNPRLNSARGSAQANPARTVPVQFRVLPSVLDPDGDGRLDYDDNCAATANADQADADGDGVGDACECLGVTCPASDACHLPGVCQPMTGACTNPVAADGTACDDGDTGTELDLCRAGACEGTLASQPVASVNFGPDDAVATRAIDEDPLSFVALGPGGMECLDTSNPSAPTRVGGWQPPFSANCTDLVKVGDLLYLACGEAGMVCLDVSTPSNPTFLYRFTLPEGPAVSCAHLDNALYVGAGNEVYIYDLTDPRTPVRRGSLGAGSATPVVRVYVDGRRVYCLYASGRLVASNAAGGAFSPVFLAAWSGPANATDLVVQNGIAYCTYNGAGLRIVSLRDPTAPELLWSDGGSPALGVAVRGTSLACIYANRRYRTCSVANPRAPVFLTDSDAGATPTLVSITRRGFAWCGYGRRASLLDIPPYVVAASPSAGRAGHCGDGPVRVYFSQGLDPATVDGASVRVLSGNSAVTGALTLDGAVATFTPSTPLPEGDYAVAVAPSVRSARGTRFAPPAGWRAGFRVTPVCTRFTEAPSAVTSGASGSFSWRVQGGSVVSATGLLVGLSPDPVLDPLEVTDNLSGAPGIFTQLWTAPSVSGPTPYFLVADANVDGATYYTSVAAVTVNPAPAPTAAWTLAPSSGVQGASRAISWSVANASNVTQTFVRWGADPRPLVAASSTQTGAQSSPAAGPFSDSLTLPAVTAPTTFYAVVVAVVNGGARTVVSPTVSFVVNPCAEGLAACGGSCVDVQTDAANCGGCGNACAAGQVCTAGACRATGCEAGYSNCDGDPSNGCETAGVCPRYLVGTIGGARINHLAYDGTYLYASNIAGPLYRLRADGVGAVATVFRTNPAYFVPRVYGEHLYWNTTAGTIERSRLDGVGAVETVRSGLPNVGAFFLEGDDLYWIDYVSGNGSLRRTSVSMGTSTTLGVTQGPWPSDVIRDSRDGSFIVSSQQSQYLWRIPAGGGARTAAYNLGAGRAGAQIAQDDQYFYTCTYQAAGGQVLRIRKDTGAVDVIASGQGSPWGIYVTPSRIYWSVYFDRTIWAAAH